MAIGRLGPLWSILKVKPFMYVKQLMKIDGGSLMMSQALGLSMATCPVKADIRLGCRAEDIIDIKATCA